jgi:hypothetical protein
MPKSYHEVLPYFKAGFAQKSPPEDVSVTWNLERLVDDGTKAFVTIVLNDPHGTHSIEETLSLRDRNKDWNYQVIYDPGLRRHRPVNEPVNRAHVMATRAFFTWLETGVLPRKWSDVHSQELALCDPAITDEEFSVVWNDSTSKVSFDVIRSDGTRIRYDFPSRVVSEDVPPKVQVISGPPGTRFRP